MNNRIEEIEKMEAGREEAWGKTFAEAICRTALKIAITQEGGDAK